MHAIDTILFEEKKEFSLGVGFAFGLLLVLGMVVERGVFALLMGTCRDRCCSPLHRGS